MERLCEGLIDRPVDNLIELWRERPIGSGPLPADASWYWRKGLWVYNGEPYVSVRSFHNEGVDFGNWGRPSWLLNIAPTNAWTLTGAMRIKKTATFAQYIFLLGSGDGTTQQQFSLFFVQSTTNNVTIRVGGAGGSASYTLPAIDTDLEYKLRSNGVTSDLWINGVKIVSNLVNGSFIDASNPFRFFGFSINPTFNADANFYNTKIYGSYADSWDVSGQYIDCFNANSPTQWDGGATANSCAGNPITFTDGTPLGRTAFSWVSLADAHAWGVL